MKENTTATEKKVTSRDLRIVMNANFFAKVKTAVENSNSIEFCETSEVKNYPWFTAMKYKSENKKALFSVCSDLKHICIAFNSTTADEIKKRFTDNTTADRATANRACKASFMKDNSNNKEYIEITDSDTAKMTECAVQIILDFVKAFDKKEAQSDTQTTKEKQTKKQTKKTK